MKRHVLHLDETTSLNGRPLGPVRASRENSGDVVTHVPLGGALALASVRPGFRKLDTRSHSRVLALAHVPGKVALSKTVARD